MELTKQQIKENFREVWVAAGSPDSNPWYWERHYESLEVAAEYSLPLANVTNVIAATSPFMPWTNNIKAARSLIEAVLYRLDYDFVKAHVQGINRNKDKAIAILENNAPELLSGPKVKAFGEMILNPASDEPPIDIHMLRAGTYDFMLDYKKAAGFIKKNYQLFVDALKELARELKMYAGDLQAAIWEESKNGIGYEIRKNEGRASGRIVHRRI